MTQRMFYSGPPRAIQSLDVARLAALAEQVNGVIEMLSAVGDTVVGEHALAARLWRASSDR